MTAAPTAGFRTYEVHQRARPADITEKIKPRAFYSAAFLDDPYSILAVVRDNTPCYRDWVGNAYWLTRYDDVTSVFVDDANFEPVRRTSTIAGFGRSFATEPTVVRCIADGTEAAASLLATRVVDDVVSSTNGTDLASEFAARFSIELMAAVIGVPSDDRAWFATRFWRMSRSESWEPRSSVAAATASQDLRVYFDRLLTRRRAEGSGMTDLLSTISVLETPVGPTTGADVIATLLDQDHETLRGSIANLWFLLLTHPDELDRVRHDDRLLKFAYLEALRHSTPLLAARRRARHEVERFGRLLPQGALMICSAAAANRDPRVFRDPDVFDVARNDLCQREPRGQYRADGLPSGLAFGLGPPSRHPAVPEDRPRSTYALTRDTAVVASRELLVRAPKLRLAEGFAPRIHSLRLGEMHTCWSLPVVV